MPAVHQVCLELVGHLKAAGFPGSALDPAEVNPPAAVWVDPRSLRPTVTLAGGGVLTVWLYCIVPATDHLQIMQMLDDGLEGLLELVDQLGHSLSDTEEPIDLRAAVLLPGRTVSLPAYRLAVDIELGEP